MPTGYQLGLKIGSQSDAEVANRLSQMLEGTNQLKSKGEAIKIVGGPRDGQTIYAQELEEEGKEALQIPGIPNAVVNGVPPDYHMDEYGSRVDSQIKKVRILRHESLAPYDVLARLADCYEGDTREEQVDRLLEQVDRLTEVVHAIQGSGSMPSSWCASLFSDLDRLTSDIEGELVEKTSST